MSDASATHSAAGEHHGPHSVGFYLLVFAVLSVLTTIELGPLFGWFNIPIWGLLCLSAVKFVIVAAVFMHLMDDHPFFSQVFGAPLIGAIMMVCVLMSLFYGWYPAPKLVKPDGGFPEAGDPFAVQERYWENWAGECSSWVRSSITHRTYCASPAISEERLSWEMIPRKAAGTSTAKPAAPTLALAGLSDDEKEAKLAKLGEELYGGKAGCVACHQPTGQGVPGAFPPLAGSDFAKFLDPVEHARIIVHGLSGKITVKGTEYNSAMPPMGAALTDEEVAAVATFERNSWGNDHGIVTPEQVASVR